MKKFNLTLTAVLIGALIVSTSCDDNSRYSFDINIATVVPEGDNAYSLLLDNGKRLWPSSTAVQYTPSNNQRVFVNYTILSDESGKYDHNIKVNDIWNILTKQAIELTEENQDSIGNDPVKANAVWVGGDYLNVSFMFNYGGEQPHAVNLVTNTMTGDLDAETVPLEFKHNSYGSEKHMLFEGFVCFDLKPFRVSDADSVKLSIKFKEWNNDITYDVVYRYNQPMTTSRVTPIPVISSNEYY